MYRANADYHHKPYRKQVSGSDIFYVCTKWYIVLFTVLHISVWFTEQSVFQFRSLYVSGAHSVSNEEIASVVKEPLKSKKYFFWNKNNAVIYPKKYVEDSLKKLNPRLMSATVTVSRKNIYVDIAEYEPAIRYCLSPLIRVDSNSLVIPLSFIESDPTQATGTTALIEDATVAIPVEGDEQLGLKEIPVPENIEGKSHDCYWADADGYIFSEAPSYLGLPIMTITEKDPSKSLLLLNEKSPIGKNIFDGESLSNLKIVMALLGDSGLSVRQILSLENNDITIDIGYPFMISLNLRKSPNDSIDHLLLALKELNVSTTSSETKVKFIDVRFSNKVFYR